MLQCGNCTQQVAQAVPILFNPVTWLLALAAITAVVSKPKKGGK